MPLLVRARDEARCFQRLLASKRPGRPNWQMTTITITRQKRASRISPPTAPMAHGASRIDEEHGHQCGLLGFTPTVSLSRSDSNWMARQAKQGTQYCPICPPAFGARASTRQSPPRRRMRGRQKRSRHPITAIDPRRDGSTT